MTESSRLRAAAAEGDVAAGAVPQALDGSGKTPFECMKANEELKESDMYWRLNDARFG